jgi:hypothetical protein
MVMGRGLNAAHLAWVFTTALMVTGCTLSPAPGPEVERYTISVGKGVSARDEQLIQVGLDSARKYFQQVLGEHLTQPVAIRVRADGCFPGSTSTAGATADALCINVGARLWPKLADGEGTWAKALAAHEHIHNLQGQLGCLPERGRREYNWFTEGMAVLLSWEALKAAGLATEADYSAWRAFAVDNDEVLQPLSVYGSNVPGDKSYVKSHDAVTRLVEKTGGDVRVLTSFCKAAKTDWRGAFAAHFGEPVETFIVSFEASSR